MTFKKEKSKKKEGLTYLLERFLETNLSEDPLRHEGGRAVQEGWVEGSEDYSNIVKQLLEQDWDF